MSAGDTLLRQMSATRQSNSARYMLAHIRSPIAFHYDKPALSTRSLPLRPEFVNWNFVSHGQDCQRCRTVRVAAITFEQCQWMRDFTHDRWRITSLIGQNSQIYIY